MQCWMTHGLNAPLQVFPHISRVRLQNATFAQNKDTTHYAFESDALHCVSSERSGLLPRSVVKKRYPVEACFATFKCCSQILMIDHREEARSDPTNLATRTVPMQRKICTPLL